MLARAHEGTRIHPDHHMFWYYAGEVLVMLDRGDEARQAYQRSLAHEPPETVRRRIEAQLQFIRDSLSRAP
jgi:predicted RNA polymerase sigma factor